MDLKQTGAAIRALSDAELVAIFATATLAARGAAAPAPLPARPANPRRVRPVAGIAPAPGPVVLDAEGKPVPEAPPEPRPGPPQMTIPAEHVQALVATVEAAGAAGTTRPAMVAAFAAPPASWAERYTKSVIETARDANLIHVIGDKRGAKLFLGPAPVAPTAG